MKAIVVGASGPVVSNVPDPTVATATDSSACVVRITRALLGDEERRAAAPRATPVTLGRAFVGVLDAIAPDAAERARDLRLAVGRRVAVHPVIRCGTCDRCTSGLGAHCANRKTLGVDRDGGFAERVALPLSVLVAIPDALDDERAAFAVAVSEAIECTRHVRVEGKAYVTIVGDGLSALVSAMVLGRLNAAVRIVSTDGAIAGSTEKLGIRHRLANEVGRRGDQHVVVDCRGTAASLALACDLVRPRGTILLRESHEPAPLAAMVSRELRLQGVALGSIQEAIDLLSRRHVEVAPLIERRVGLADVPSALAAPGHLATLVRGD
jgi:D-arabinose 1-dehydrogenase-like Zn-dependent alcohol dehydrogenase